MALFNRNASLTHPGRQENIIIILPADENPHIEQTKWLAQSQIRNLWKSEEFSKLPRGNK